MGRDLRIVYMGTPEFAVAPLKALVDGGYNVVATITVADKPAQRGMKLQASPVKQYAVEHGLPVLQPVSLKDPQFLEELRSYKADLQVVVAFRMLPEVVWAMPPMGTFNLHASLLPQYRGAAPINWAIINGDAETGVTTFFLNHTIDTGNIIMQRRTPILPEDNIGTLYDRLMEIGAGVVCETVDMIASGRVETTPQIESNDLRPAPKIFKEDCFIDWTRPVQYLHNFVRGLCPYPVAYTNLTTANGEELRVKVYEAKAEPAEHNAAPGTVASDGKTYLKIAAAGGWLHILKLQPAGKRPMLVSEFLRGNNVLGTLRQSLRVTYNS